MHIKYFGEKCPHIIQCHIQWRYTRGNEKKRERESLDFASATQSVMHSNSDSLILEGKMHEFNSDFSIFFILLVVQPWTSI